MPGTPLDPTSTPITTTNDTVAALQTQLGEIQAAKSAALAKILSLTTQASANGGAGPDYSISGRAGGESVNWSSFLSELRSQVAEFTKLEKMLIELLAELQPWQLHQIKSVGNGL